MSPQNHVHTLTGIMLTGLVTMAYIYATRFCQSALLIVPKLANVRTAKYVYIRKYIGVIALQGHQTNLTMTVASDPIRNNTWPSLVKILPIDCLRGSWGSLRVIDTLARGDFAAQ